MSEAKKNRPQYSAKYIKYEFMENPTNTSEPMCLIFKWSAESLKFRKVLNLKPSFNVNNDLISYEFNESFVDLRNRISVIFYLS